MATGDHKPSLTLREQDLRIESFRAGIGYPVVRKITHLPTGISIQSDGNVDAMLSIIESRVAANGDQLTYENGP